MYDLVFTYGVLSAYITPNICFISYKRLKLDLRMYFSFYLWACHEATLEDLFEVLDLLVSIIPWNLPWCLFKDDSYQHSSFVLWLIVGHSLHTGMSNSHCGKTTHHFTESQDCSNCIGLILYHPSTGKITLRSTI